MDRKLQRHRADSLRQHGFLVSRGEVSAEDALVNKLEVLMRSESIRTMHGAGRASRTKLHHTWLPFHLLSHQSITCDSAPHGATKDFENRTTNISQYGDNYSQSIGSCTVLTAFSLVLYIILKWNNNIKSFETRTSNVSYASRMTLATNKLSTAIAYEVELPAWSGHFNNVPSPVFFVWYLP